MKTLRGPSNLTALLATAWLYFAIVFSIAFVMGILRGLVVAPRLGETIAVFLEIPALLAVSWFVARRLLQKRSFAGWQLILIGAIAFILTMICEAGLADLIRGQSLAQWAASLIKPLGLAGLAGQLAFALMPALAGRSRNRLGAEKT